MKIKPGYTLRAVLDMYVVLGSGKDAYRPNTIMSTNETGAFLWGLLEKGAAEEELTEKLLKEYAVDQETAKKDIAAFIAQLKEKDLIADA